MFEIEIERDNMKKEISKMDIDNLKLIRENVRNLIKDCALNFDRSDYSVLDIAPQDHKGASEFFHSASIKTLDLNPDSGADIIADLCEDNSSFLAEEQFDLIICTEVLEHTLNPFAAVNEIYRLLKKGGTAAISTPFNFRIHGPLPDCWRFTEHGIRELFKNFSSVNINSLESDSRELMPVHYLTIAGK